MAISGTTFGPELLVELDWAAPEPLHRQLANGLRDAIRTGRLAPATRLPSTRVLGVSRRLVVDAYSQLAPKGSCSADTGPARGWRPSTPPGSAARRRRSCEAVRHRLRARLTGSR